MGIASPERVAPRRHRAPAPTLDELWEHHDYLCAITRRIVRDAATAEDVVQETYVRALQHLDDLDPDQSIRGWLATVARRVAIDEVRRTGRHAVPVHAVPDRVSAAHHELTDALVFEDTLADARAAIAGLGDRERRLLIRRVAEGRSVHDLAEEEGATVRAIESVLTRARAKVAAALDRGAAVFLPGLAGLKRWLWERTIDAEGVDADAATAPPMSRSTGEVLAAGTAAVVIAASLFVGGADTPATTRVETEGRPDAEVSLPMYGTEDADRVATLDRAAAPVTAEAIAAAVGELFGVPAPSEGTPAPDPQASPDGDPGADPPGPNQGGDGWWPRYAEEKTPAKPGPGGVDGTTPDGPDARVPGVGVRKPRVAGANAASAGDGLPLAASAPSAPAEADRRSVPDAARADLPASADLPTTSTTVPERDGEPEGDADRGPEGDSGDPRCASNQTLQTVCDVTGWPPPGLRNGR